MMNANTQLAASAINAVNVSASQRIVHLHLIIQVMKKLIILKINKILFYGDILCLQEILLYEGQRQRAQDKSRQDWDERTQDDPTNPADRYRMSVEEDTVNRMADAENNERWHFSNYKKVERQKDKG